jgi:hypothetical protein
MDGLYAPKAVLPGHLLDQSDGFQGDPGAPTPIARLEPPEQPEALAMPAQERIGLEDEEGFLPTPEPAGEEDKPEAIGWGESWLVDLAVKDDELLAEERVLGNELGIATSEIEGGAEKDRIARRPGELEGSAFQGQQCGVYGSDNSDDYGRHAEKTLDGQSTPINGVYCRSDRGLLSGGWGFRPGQVLLLASRAGDGIRTRESLLGNRATLRSPAPLAFP